MLEPGQSLELGNYRMKILELLGGQKNLSYKAMDLSGDQHYILRVIEKPDPAEFKREMTAEKELLLKRFFQENEILREKYGSYNEMAGFEILSSAFQGQVVFEARILKDYKHEGLSNLLFYTQDEHAYYLVLDYIEGKNLQEISAEEIDEAAVLRWMRQVAEVLKFFHTHQEDRILYNNLNPLNIVIDMKGNARLVDLQKIKIYDPESGKCEEWQDVLHLDSLAPYCPLEGYQDPQAEIYALGVTFYSFLTGVQAPAASDRAAHDTLKPLREINSKFSKKLSTLISLCLELSPKNRWSDIDSLLRAIDDESFPELKVECNGQEIKFLELDRMAPSWTRSFEIKVAKPMIEKPGIRINAFNSRWNIKPEAEEPRLDLKNIRQGDETAQAELSIKAHELAEGIYEGIASIDTNWGPAELPVKLQVRHARQKTPLFIAGAVVAWVIIIILFCMLFPSNPYKKIKTHWNRDNWDHFKFTVPSFIIPSVNLADAKKWVVYLEVPGVSVVPAKESVRVSGTSDADTSVRTGWISSFFLPAGNMTVSINMDSLDKTNLPDTAGVMLLSSNGNAAAVEYDRASHKFRKAYRNEETWSAEDLHGSSKGWPETLKISYSRVDETASVSIGGSPDEKISAKIILDDIAIFFYTTLSKRGEKLDVAFKDLVVTAGQTMPRMPPYYQITTDVSPIMKSPEKGAKRVIDSLKEEHVVVQEERDDWCRIKTIVKGHYEGWLKKSELRDLYPKEIILDMPGGK